MPYSTYGKNLLIGALPSPLYASIHTADPGDNGANEVVGGSPAYARKAVTLAAASGGVRSVTNQPVFDIPINTTINYVGYWTAAVGGSFVGSAQVLAEGPYLAQGQYTLTTESFRSL